MADKRTVLIVNTVGMDYEGMSSVILNYLRNMPREGLELHITVEPDTCPDLCRTLEAFGILHTIPNRKEDLKGYLLGLYRILRSGMDVLHIHGNSATMAIEAMLATFCGTGKILVHSHSTKTDHPLANAVLRYPMLLCARERIACSVDSGKWLYRNARHTVLNNAIDLSRFRFDPEVRKQCRAELDIGEAFLVGHVGYFADPKNQSYLIDVFQAFHRQKPDTKLLLVGTGPDLEDAVEQVARLQLQDAVIFAGRRTDVERIYQALDVFVMPSLWEGLPLVLLEAQAAGLPVLASDRITGDVQCVPNFRYLPLEAEPEVWAEQLRNLSEETADRTADTAQYLRNRGFDIRTEAGRLRELYLK